MKRLKDEIKAKSEQIDLLEKQIADSFIASDNRDQSGVLQACSVDIIASLLHLLIVN